jgi:uncharacterized membrane protein
MTINPFDLKSVLLAKHAQHVVVIHFPIALFLAGVLFDFVAVRKKNPAFSAAAYFNFTCAAISSVFAIVTGVVAWRWALEGQKLKGILLMHMALGWLSTLLIWGVWLIHRRARRKPEQLLPRYRYLVEAAAVVVITLTGHLGGFLSGVNSAN